MLEISFSYRSDTENVFIGRNEGQLEEIINQFDAFLTATGYDADPRVHELRDAWRSINDNFYEPIEAPAILDTKAAGPAFQVGDIVKVVRPDVIDSGAVFDQIGRIVKHRSDTDQQWLVRFPEAHDIEWWVHPDALQLVFRQ